LIIINSYLSIEDSELQLAFVRSPGPGGQNVNKVATAVLLRFNIQNSASIPDDIKSRLLVALANRLTTQGDLIIKASRHRTQERNKQDAIERFAKILKAALISPKKRKKTRPTLASKEKHLKDKKRRAKNKSLRSKKFSHDD